MNNEYSARMTGAGFLLYEIKAIAKLIIENATEEDIERKVYDDNLFQYNKPASIKRIFPLVRERCKVLPIKLLQLLVYETVANAKLINLLSIMEEDKLFKDFMVESVGECYRDNDLLYGKVDVNRYFNVKSEQDSKVAGFKDSTRNKLRQVFLKILVEAGILSKIKDGELIPVSMDVYLKERLSELGYGYFINLLEGN